MPMLLVVSISIALAAWVTVLLLPWQPHRTRERLEASSARPELRDVAVLIPARNEAATIERTLTALSRQGPGLEVVVVDDESSDGTADLCRRWARAKDAREGDSRLFEVEPEEAGAYAVTLRVVAGRPRPAGWSGKLWALEQGFASIARTRVLLLDADIELAPGTIAALLDRARDTGSDLVSIMATLRCETFAERLLAPPFVFFFKLLYPFALAASRHSRVAAGAGGCMLVTTSALRGLGGFAPLRGALIDDCTLAAALKRRGHGIWIGLSRSVRSLRPYTFRDFWRMVSRTAYTQLGYSPALLLATTGAMAVVFAAPVVALVVAPTVEATLTGAAALAAMCVAYRPVVRFYGLPSAWTLTLPIAAALFLGMTWDSALGYWRGVRARWKDRAYGVEDEVGDVPESGDP